MLQADALVFGAPAYYGTINALGHACLERTFCFRHKETFSLAGMLGVAIGVDGARGEAALEALRISPVLRTIRMFMESNKMTVVDWVYARGYS
jgi:multimeric flavodoxin WrbA